KLARPTFEITNGDVHMTTTRPTYTSIIPVRDTVVFPKTTVTLSVGRPGSVEALHWAGENDLWILCVTQRDAGVAETPSDEELYDFGTLCRIKKMVGNSRFGFQVIAEGIVKVKITKIERQDETLFAHFEEVEDSFNEH